jgi:hypothetical protein
MTVPHGLLGKAYAPTFCLLIAILADTILGMTVWHYTTWFTGLSAMVAAPLVGFILWICIAQPTSGEG